MKGKCNFLSGCSFSVLEVFVTVLAIVLLFGGILLFEYLTKGLFMGFGNLNQLIADHWVGTIIYCVVTILLFPFCFGNRQSNSKEKDK